MAGTTDNRRQLASVSATVRWTVLTPLMTFVAVATTVMTVLLFAQVGLVSLSDAQQVAAYGQVAGLVLLPVVFVGILAALAREG